MLPPLTVHWMFESLCYVLIHRVLMQAAAPPSTDPASLGRQDDGYRAARFCAEGVPLLREQLLALLQGARFWDKSCDWMQVRCAAMRSSRARSRTVVTLSMHAGCFSGAACWAYVYGKVSAVQSRQCPALCHANSVGWSQSSCRSQGACFHILPHSAAVLIKWNTSQCRGICACK